MKRAYTKPYATKLVFNYLENVTASGCGGYGHVPGHGHPHKPHPVFPVGKP